MVLFVEIAHTGCVISRTTYSELYARLKNFLTLSDRSKFLGEKKKKTFATISFLFFFFDKFMKNIISFYNIGTYRYFALWMKKESGKIICRNDDDN